MTTMQSPRPWEADFIRLWQAGATQAAIAEALGCPVGTVKTRAQRLVAQGKLAARPRGGAYPHRQRQAQVAEPPAATLHPSGHDMPSTVQTEPALPGAEHAALRVLLEEVLRPVLARLTALEAEVQALRAQGQTLHGAWAALPGAEPADLAPEARKSERWNIYVPRWVRQAVEAEAAAQQRAPSWVLQAIVRQWLAAREGP
jgi:hypothetical protein